MKKIKLKIKNNKGFVILFAVTISAILLSIAIGVTNIAFREVKFSTSVKSSNDAFLAADAGIECAMVYDKSVGGVFINPNPSFNITCNNNLIAVAEGPASFWSFVVVGLGSGGQSCAIVTMNKAGLPPCPASSICIVSKGYNNNGGGTCTPGLNTIERQIELSY